VQLADFGLSTTFGHGHLLKTYCGSPLYASPEIVNARPYVGPEVMAQLNVFIIVIVVFRDVKFFFSKFKLCL